MSNPSEQAHHPAAGERLAAPQATGPRFASATTALIALMSLFFALPALAQVGGQAPAGSGASSSSRFAGSMVSLRNQVGAPSFNRGALPDYNPNVSIAMLIAPRSLSALTTVTRELTDADWTTQAGETTLSDTFLTGGVGLLSSKSTGLALSGALQVRAPTSKSSLANGMVAGVLAGFTGSWSASFAPFGWKQSLSLALIGRVGPFFHRTTTGSLQTPWLDGCAELAGGCGQFAHNGVRTPLWRAQGIGALTWNPLDRLSISFQGGVFYDRLRDVAAATSRAGFVVPADPTDPSARGIIFTALYANLSVHPALSFALGSETGHLQLAPDSTYRQPFFNQFTTVLFAVRVFPDALFARAQPAG
jgi:hypothetical protein